MINPMTFLESWINKNLYKSMLQMLLNLFHDKFDIQKYTLDSSYNYHRSRKLYDIIISHMNSLSSARKKLGHIATPISLVEEMLDKLLKDVWQNPFYKWFDQAVRRGAFVL